MKIAYIGIDLLYPALLSLHRAGCEIKKIFTCDTDNKTEFNRKIISFAQEHKIPYTLDKMEKKDVERLIEEGCELIVCGGYYHRLPIDEKIPMVNIHPSLLPVGRGGWPMPVIIKEGFSKSGVTLHKISENIDEGDILLQKEFYLTNKEDLKTYMEKVEALLPDMMEELKENLAHLYLNARPQGRGEYWSLPKEEDYTVRSDMSMEEADRILRAFYGYEVIYRGRAEAFELVDAFVSSQKKRDAYFELSLRDGYIRARSVKRLD